MVRQNASFPKDFRAALVRFRDLRERYNRTDLGSNARDLRGATLTGVFHPGDEALLALTLGKLMTAESLRVQKHIFDCPGCLKRLIEVETLLAIADEEHPPYRLQPDITKPLFIRHDTADGFIYSRVEKHGDKWLEHHWGDQLQGQHECRTLLEANEHALAAFEQMFPEHRCTDRCCLDPIIEP